MGKDKTKEHHVTIKEDKLKLRIKVTLRLLQDGRTGVILDVQIVEKDGAVARQMREQGRCYMDQVTERKAKAKKKDRMDEEELGPPHIYVFAGLLGGLIQLGDVVGGRSKELVAKEVVRVARIEKCHKADMSRILLVLPRSGFQAGHHRQSGAGRSGVEAGPST